ncbi:type-F conjugative transfer system pilin assembly protein TrbC [Photobacterium damselae]|uniref:Conjugative transfer protein TrbC n=2 Tax=Photobacterium damselae TaxID=38293 RepID=D0Z538_PHODD|nr:type-F conjugative transfer system pilin assembly protein TrbC [Photobacterium damselae]EEZ39255.1 conjugative transfer protein TrbC [Photobacterium damselae subsp. damselae CIP 102761]PSW80316.1 type-F conjugative transfer system pilin assembly protein TrbC [Photobacterium damselae]SPY45169.1 conjugal transfer pilus assembly protein TrbC [Photobacterium damselae]
MKPAKLALILLCSVGLPVQAWTEQETHELQRQKEAQAASFFTPDTNTLNIESLLKAKQYKKMAQALNDEANNRIISTQNPNAAPPSVLIFASLNMPSASLKQLLYQANQYRLPVVIRGVLPGGFTQTVNMVQGLVAPNHAKKPLGGVSINPIWFKQFNIKQVSAFVVMKEGACQGKPPCDPDNYDVVYGNVSVFDALTTLGQRGQYADIANRVIAQ